MSQEKKTEVVTRRYFLAGSASAAAAAIIAAGAEAAPAAKPAAPAAKPAPKPATTAATKPAPKPAAPPPPPVNVAIIGFGTHGRELAASLSRAPGANIVAVSDSYEGILRRATQAAPKAAQVVDYRQVLDDKSVQAVFIATPTHLHKDIAIAAIQAGKHVYCESPMAHTLEDARAIAKAAAGSKQIFQVGQQYRGNPQHHHVHKFVHSAALGRITHGRAQWHKRTTWRQAHGNPDRERALNWRLDPELSLGLIGECGIHSLDVCNWFLAKLPKAVYGFSSILYDDGRKVPDTVQCVLEYDNGVRFIFDATLTNSYDGAHEVFLGTDSAVLLRDQRAWMFKEADAPLLGWEVYARKEEVGDETGIALVADASKQLAEGKIPGKEKQTLDPGKTPLYFAAESFLNCIRENKKPDCGPVEGYQALVTALKANEAAVKGTKISFQQEWFSL